MNILLNLNNSPYGRSILSGVLAAASAEPQCMLWLNNPNIPQPSKPGHFDGAIGGASLREAPGIIGHIPAININSNPIAGTWQVCSDNELICRMAFDHLYEHQIRQFCYIHLQSGSTSEIRLEMFRKIVSEGGCACKVLEIDDPRAYKEERFPLAEQLREIPLPFGVFVPRDDLAPQVYAACRELGLNIPDEVSILSVNNTFSVCTAMDPPLTSIELEAEGIGSRALSLLLDIIRGLAMPQQPILYPPRELVPRGSTARKLKRDENVVKVIDYMQAHIREPVVLEDLLREQTLSQSVFERRFKRETGMSPMRYLRHLRIERAKQLLEQTDMKVVEIARECGIPDPNHLCAIFRKQLKTTPLEYRRQQRRSS